MIRKRTIPDRFTITLPDPTDKLILTALMQMHGISKSGAIRAALREWARKHGVLPDTPYETAATATTPAGPPAG